MKESESSRSIGSVRVGRTINSFRNPSGGRFGYALFRAQEGKQYHAAKPLKGFGSAGVLEVVEDDRGSSYRAIYTVRFADIVFVLHVFQKKSKTGIKTPDYELNVVRKRLKDAEREYSKIIKKRSS